MAGRIGWLNKPNHAWVVSSWTFRQLLEDVLTSYPDDPEMATEFKIASDVKHLYLDSFSPDLAGRVIEAIRETASAISSGRVPTRLAVKPYGTSTIVVEYRQSLEKLVAMIGSLPDVAP
jgi:hypothetical protein